MKVLKKNVGFALLGLFVLLIVIPGHVESKKMIYILTQDLTQPVLDKIVISKKSIDGGLRILFKTRDTAKIDMLKAIFAKCTKIAATPEANNHPFELLYSNKVKWTIIETPKGIQLEMISDQRDMVKIIRKVLLPRRIYRSEIDQENTAFPTER